MLFPFMQGWGGGARVLGFGAIAFHAGVQARIPGPRNGRLTVGTNFWDQG